MINLGHNIMTVEECGLTGADDETVLRKAVNENRAFLTRDMHFSNILLYPPKNSLGNIVLKITPMNMNRVHQTLNSVLDHYTQKSIRKKLVIVDHNKFREHR